MNNQAKIKLEKIKKLKLPEKVRATADKIEKGLESQDEATRKKAEDALNKLFDQIKAVAAKQREEKTEKEVSEKTIVPENADLAAPEAKKELSKKVSQFDEAIDKALANDPELAGFGKSDKKRDAGRKALPAGRRVSKKGWSNQYGKSVGGRVYYENRENRKDRKSPSYKGGYPFFAKGGKIHPMDEEDGTYYVNIYKEKNGSVVSVDEREYQSKSSAMTFAMMKRDFLKVGESIFVMNDDGDVLYTSVGTKKMAMGGKFAWQNAEVGDSARVILENKTGVIVVTYGRRFHLKFPDGTEKTYSAEELEFIDNDEYAHGGEIDESRAMLLSQNKEIEHHTKELKNAIKNNHEIEPWVIGKMERAASDLSDVTHYLDGKSEYAKGGYMTNGGENGDIGSIGNYRVTPMKRRKMEKSPDIVETDFSKSFSINGSLSEANEKAQEFVIKNNETHPTATVTKLHPSGNPLKNKIITYITKDEILKYAKGGYMAKGENYEYINNFTRFESNVPVDDDDFKKFVDAYHKKLSGDRWDEIKYELLKDRMGNYLGHKTMDKMESYVEKTHEAHKMAKGGAVDSYKEHKKNKLNDLNTRIDEINKYLKKIENINTKEAYDETKNLIEYRSNLQAQKLHLEDSTYAKGGNIESGSAHIYVSLNQDVLKVYHGGDVRVNKEDYPLLKRINVKEGFWNQIWKDLRGDGTNKTMNKNRGSAHIYINMENGNATIYHGDGVRVKSGATPLYVREGVDEATWDNLWHDLRNEYAKGGYMKNGGDVKSYTFVVKNLDGKIVFKTKSLNKASDYWVLHGKDTHTVETLDGRVISYADGGVLENLKRGDKVLLKDGNSTREAIVVQDGLDNRRRVRVRPDRFPMDMSVFIDPSPNEPIYVIKKLSEGGYMAKGGYIQRRNIKLIIIKNPNKKGSRNFLQIDKKYFLDGLHMEKGGKIDKNYYTYIKRADVNQVVYQEKGETKIESNPKNGFWVSNEALNKAGRNLGKTFKKDDVVYNKETKTLGIVRSDSYGDGTTNTDSEGIVSTDLLEKYNPLTHALAKMAGSTRKEIVDRKLLDEEDLPTERKQAKIFNATNLRKSKAIGWTADTYTTDKHFGYDWKISTFKSGDYLKSIAQAGKDENGIWSFMLYQDPRVVLISGDGKRVTEKLVGNQQEEALSKFLIMLNDGSIEEKVDKKKMASGGKIGFDALSKKVASRYEGKKVKPKYQSEYGKTYDKAEAKEVGDKVAAKVYRMQQGKMANGGELAKGIRTEMKEHGMSREEATKTAKDHLREDAKYYTKMAKIGLKDGGKIDLPHELDRYFTKPKGTIEVEISKLIPIRARKSGIENAEVYMKKAYDGEMSKRKPIEIYKTRNKKYRVNDGNSTFAVAKKNGWSTIYATVVPNPNVKNRVEKSTFAIAKEIRKEGESWSDAVKRVKENRK